MIKILFVCHGNICRSPMAELVMKDLVRRAGAEARYAIASAATSAEELGNPVYPPARKELMRHGIGCAGKTARKMTPQDYADYDLLIGMDSDNLMNMRRITCGDPQHKCRLLLDGDEVADPWYTGDFAAAYRDIERGCRVLFSALEDAAR